MNLKPSAIVCLIFLIAPSVNAGEPLNFCSRILRDLTEPAAEVLPPSVLSARIEGELLDAGNFLSPQQKFTALNDGDYVYIIDKNGTVGFSNRVPDHLNFKEPLASHRSVYHRLESATHKIPQIIAAGEFEIRQGRVALFNNKSGTFRGGAKQLEIAEATLNRHGLQFEPLSTRVDYSIKKVANKHFSELAAARASQALQSRAETKVILQKMDDFQKQVYRHYPGQEPGSIDWSAFLHGHDLKLGAKSHFDFDDAVTETGQEWLAFLQNSQDFTESPVRLQKLISKFGEAETSRMIDLLSQYEGVFNR
jgi:hypothetical protein